VVKAYAVHQDCSSVYQLDRISLFGYYHGRCLQGLSPELGGIGEFRRRKSFVEFKFSLL